MVARGWWAGASGSPRSRRTFVALTSQARELLRIQLDLTSAPQTNLRCQPKARETEGMVPRCAGACLGHGAEVPHTKLLVQTWYVCVGWLLLGRRRTVVALRQKARQERVMVEARIREP